MGLLDNLFDPENPNYVRNQGLLNMASQLFQAAGPSETPISTAQALGMGLQGYGTGTAGARQQLLAQKKEGRLQQYQDMLNSLYKAYIPATPTPGAPPPISGMPPTEGAPPAPSLPPGVSLKGGQINIDPAAGIQARIAEADAIRRGVLPAKPGGRAPLITPEQESNLAKLRIEEAIKRESAARNEEEKKAVKANTMLDLASQARALLPKASGGLPGAAVATVAGAAGISTDTTKANQQLELISGWMVSNVPRMEGPQSDFDVKNYKTMAARIGDKTVPVQDRMAALDTLEQLQRKYTGGVPAAKTIVKTGTYNGRKVVQYSDGTTAYAD